MIAFKVVRVIGNRRISAVVDAPKWMKEYFPKRKTSSKQKTFMLAFDDLRCAIHFRDQWVQGTSEIWECEVERARGHALVSTCSLWNIKTIGQYWERVRNESTRGTPPGTIFCRTLKMVKLVL